MADIFISYASDDRSRVEPLAKALENQGWSVWWDRTIPPGKTFDQVIEEAITAAKCVVVLWSEISKRSDWVKEEATIGKRRQILVPAKIDFVEPTFGFGMIHAADLTDWREEISHPGYTSLINAISGIVGPSSKIEKSQQIAEIPESSLEQQSEVQPEVRETSHPTPRQTKPAKVNSPRCFISYSWDSEQHQEWVRKLATRLRECGVDAILDQFHCTPGTDLTKFMEKSVRESSFVLLVCTPNFTRKADAGVGGVGYEKVIITGEIFAGEAWETKFVPVLREGKAKESLPSYLKSRFFIDFREDSFFENKLEELLRHFYGKPLYPPPPIGTKPDWTKPKEAPPVKKHTVSKPAKKSSASTPAQKPLLEQTIKNNIGMEFVLIQAGSFMMGSHISLEEVVRIYGGQAEWFKGEHPQHKVTISDPFYLQATAVTQGQWEKVTGKNPSKFNKCGDDCPVEKVSWDDAQDFIKKLNEMGIDSTDNKYRLPTEAEWEYACRAGTTTEFFFGDDAGKLREYAWFDVNSKDQTHPVGTKEANSWGLYDMLGNVWEWVEDDWHDDYNKDAPDDGRAWGVDDPRGVARVLRGGSWSDGSRGCRAAGRYGREPDDRNLDVGFRLARSVALGP